MRYWTAFKTTEKDRGYQPAGYMDGKASYVNDVRIAFYIAEDSGAAEMARLFKEGLDISDSVMLALVDPTQEDLLALGNAVVYLPDRFEAACMESPDTWRRKKSVASNVRLVVRPQDFDGFVSKYRAQAVRRSESGSWRAARGLHYGEDSWLHPEDLLFIKNGEVFEPMCDGCPDVGGRVVGKCHKHFSNCGYPLFDAGARITLPPKELYVPKNKCTKANPFYSITPCDLVLDISPEAPVVKEPSVEAVRSGETRAFRLGVCKHCIFSWESGGTYKCFHGYPGIVRRCNGPHFESDIPPADDFTDVRRYMYTDGHLNWSDFLRAEEEGFFEHNKPGNWRVNPELRYGYVCNNKVRITASRRGLKYFIDLDVDEMDKLFQLVGKTPPVEPSTPATPFERVVCHAIKSGSMNRVRLASGSFGNCGMCLFMGGEFCNDGASCIVHFHHVTFNDSRTMRTIPAVGEVDHGYSYHASYPGMGQRNRNLQNTFFHSKAPKEVRRKVVIDYVARAAEASKAGAPLPEFVPLGY